MRSTHSRRDLLAIVRRTHCLPRLRAPAMLQPAAGTLCCSFLARRPYPRSLSDFKKPIRCRLRTRRTAAGGRSIELRFTPYPDQPRAWRAVHSSRPPLSALEPKTPTTLAGLCLRAAAVHPPSPANPSTQSTTFASHRYRSLNIDSAHNIHQFQVRLLASRDPRPIFGLHRPRCTTHIGPP